MNEKLRKFLEENGLRADASEQEAWALYDKLQAAGVDPGIEPGKRSAPQDQPSDGGGDTDEPAARTQPAAPAAGKRSDDGALDPAIQAQIDRAAAQARAEQQRMINSIDQRLQAAGLHGDMELRSQIMADEHMTLERASAMIFERMSKQNPPLGAGVQVGTEAPEKLRAAVTDGLLLRSGHRVEKPADGAREFRGRTLMEISREVLEANGQNCRGLSRMEVASRALAAGSTSDFAHIFSSLVNRTLQRAYQEWPSTWQQFTAITGANDFRDIHSIKLSGSPDLEGLNENGEYKMASFSDAKESYRVITKGIMVPLTRQMIINDDLRAFARVPQLFGTSARRMEGDAVYSLITSNGQMSDGKALFHADHKNLTSTGTALSSTSLGVGRTMMRKQKGLKGERIDVQPAFLLVPVVKETDAEILLRSAALPEDNKSAGVYNPWAGKLTPIADPHLDDASATAWYLLAHPNQVPVIEAAYLEGEEQPYVEEMVDFNSDALKIKVRHDFGAGVVDHVGAYKNNGA